MRRATVEDAKGIAELDMVLFPDNCFNETTLASEIEAGYAWVAYDDCQQENVIAYALVRLDGDMGDLIRLGVREDYQGQGIGTQLLGLVTSPVNQMMLTVRKKNLGALRLYLRTGYRIIGQLDAYGEQSWVMLLTCETK